MIHEMADAEPQEIPNRHGPFHKLHDSAVHELISTAS